MLASQYDATPEAALREIGDFPGAVLVDLDETLYLRNSTEDFIDSVRPATLAFLLMKMIDLLQPWRLSGGRSTRDVWRVMTLLICMPWSLVLWRRQARRLGRESVNPALLAALRSREQVSMVATLGFWPIVRPLVAAMGVPNLRVIAMPLWSFRARRAGKQALVTAAVGEQTVRESLVVTDSLDDEPLLRICARPMRVIWPQARFQPAFQQVYVPGLYITRIKRPGNRFIYRSIISDEFSVWVLASLVLATQPVVHVLGLALLSLSFWSIYEIGYVDNDRVGLLYEKDPNLTKEFFERPVHFPTVMPWVWATACGIPALMLLRWPVGVSAADLLTWAAVLVGTFVWFRIYNRIDKHSRIWFFGGLQLLRSTAFMAIVPATPIGVAALVAHALTRWVHYYMYRITGTKYSDEFSGVTRLMFFIVISVFMGMSFGWRASWTVVEFVLLAWLAFKARRQLAHSLRIIHWLKAEPKSHDRPASAVSKRGAPG